MIKDKEVKIKMFGTNIKYYNDLGFKCQKGDELNIPIKLVNKNSHLKITAICDICGKENYIVIKNYYNQINKGNKKIYTCFDCSFIKSKQTRKEKYGDENFTNRKQAKKTLLKKYGVDHVSKIPGHYNKVNKTMKDRYGCHFSKTPEFLEKFKKTMNDNFSVDYPMQSEKIQEKSKKTLMKRYGVNNISQLKTNFEKVQKSSLNISKFGKTDLYYQGCFELDFLKNFYDKIDISNAPSIKYLFEEDEHIYFPDFYIRSLNLIVEIKSSYYYERDYKQIKEKENSVIKNGFKYILIIDKEYDEFIKVIQ